MKRERRKTAARVRRHHRVRGKVSGTSAKPRLCVFRSLKHVYCQVIDDAERRTLAAASTLSPEVKGVLAKTSNVGAAEAVGELIGRKAAEAGVKKVVFDRGGFKYHGRVKALAEAARKAGLEF